MNIYDIAELAGVSIATVSRVLNDSPNVAEKTKARVRGIMEEHGYIPSGFSRRLGMNALKTIGLICPDAADDYMAKSVACLERSLREHGYDSLLYCSGYGYEDCRFAVKALLHRKVDALVLIGSVYADDDPDSERVNYVREAAKQVPVFLINGYVRGDDVCCAVCDDYEASRAAAAEMIASGRRKILFLTDMDTVSTNLKRQGCQDALAKAGLKLCGDVSVGLSNQINQTCDHLLRLQELDVDGIFAANDALAAGALKYAKRRGVAVPGDLCIIGYNNSELSVCCNPELSTIDSRERRLCQIAVDFIKLRLSGRPVGGKVSARGCFIRRGTTDF
ncbi:MAG: LacI family transcriptional regulator [Oscillospiraceae bacterium]|nr:LacI family transcriptional regulator [Oscillospiraceae bacterium]